MVVQVLVDVGSVKPFELCKYRVPAALLKPGVHLQVRVS